MNEFISVIRKDWVGAFIIAGILFGFGIYIFYSPLLSQVQGVIPEDEFTVAHSSNIRLK